MYQEKKSFTLNQILIYIMIIGIIFFPRTIAIAGMYSYRFVILLCFALMLLISKGKMRIDINALGISTIFFFGMAFFRYISVAQIPSGIGYLVETIVWFVLFTNVIKKREELNLFHEFFIKCIFVYSVLGVIECFTGFNLWGTISGTHFVSYRYGVCRSYGCFYNYTNNSIFLLLALALVAWKIVESKKRNIFYIITYILIIANIFATLTRISIVCALIFNIILLFKFGLLRYIKKYFAQIVIAMLIILTMVILVPSISNLFGMMIDMFLAIFDDDVANGISSSFGANANGIGHRFLLYAWVWDVVKEHAVFGIGPNIYFSYNYITSAGTHMVKDSIENQYLITLYRFGIVGLILYFIMLIAIVKKMFVAQKREKLLLIEKNYKVNPLFLIMVVILIYLASGLFFAYGEEFKMLFLLISMASLHIKFLNEENVK